MQYKLLSDLELSLQTKQAAQKEKQATLELLEYLSEVDERMLYAKRGYSTLWLYVHQELGYSESQSSERVAAMRLMRKSPEVKDALKENELTLTAVNKIAYFAKQEKAFNSEAKVSIKALVEECKNKTSREVEKLLLSKSSNPQPVKPESLKLITPDVTRITFDADEEMMQLIQKLKEAHHNPAITIKELIRESLKERLHQLEKKKTLLRAPEVKKNPAIEKPLNPLVLKSKQKASVQSDFLIHAPEVQRKRSRFITKSVKVEVAQKANHQCEYVDPITHKRCASTTALQYDHIRPYAKGGLNTGKNLRLYCGTHNRLHAIEAYGVMNLYSKR